MTFERHFRTAVRRLERGRSTQSVACSLLGTLPSHEAHLVTRAAEVYLKLVKRDCAREGRQLGKVRWLTAGSARRRPSPASGT